MDQLGTVSVTNFSRKDELWVTILFGPGFSFQPYQDLVRLLHWLFMFSFRSDRFIQIGQKSFAGLARAYAKMCACLQGRALYAAEADRLRNWAENRTRLSLTDAMEMYTENTWVSVFSLSVVCAFIILQSTTPSSFPGT